MTSQDKFTKEPQMATRTRSVSKKSVKMVAPHPEDDIEEDPPVEENDAMPELAESDAASTVESEDEEPQPSTSKATPVTMPKKKKKNKARRGRKLRQTEPEKFSDEEPPPLVGDETSEEEAPKKVVKSRSSRKKTPVLPRPILRSKKNKKKNKTRVVDVSEPEQSAEESSYETAADYDPEPYPARRRNYRHRLTKTSRPRTEPIYQQVRQRFHAGGDIGMDPEFPEIGDSWDDADIDCGPPEFDFDPYQLHSRRVSIRNEALAPTFDGTNFKAFKIQFLDVCHLNGWSDAEKVVRLRCSLVGEAMQILNTAGIDEWRISQWWDEMELRHGQIKAVCDVSNQILEMQKGQNQSALAFADSLETVALKSEMNKSQRESICYTAFVHGIRNFRKLQHYVMRRDKVKSINSAARCASWYEREMGMVERSSNPIGTVNVDARTVMEKQLNSKITVTTDDKSANGATTEAFVSINPTVNQFSAFKTAPVTGEDLENFWLKLSEKIEQGNKHLQSQITRSAERLDEGDRARQFAKERRQANYQQNNNGNYNNGDNYNNGGNYNNNGGRRFYNNKKKNNKQGKDDSNGDKGDAESAQSAKVSTTTQA